MTTALVLGGADCLFTDIAAYNGPIDGVIACNDAGAVWSGHLTAWVSIHANKFPKWESQREANGYSKAGMLVSHKGQKHGVSLGVDLVTSLNFNNTDQTGSSGLFAAKVALVDLGFDTAILCGVPMQQENAHFFDSKDWVPASAYRPEWLRTHDCYLNRMRSMSGWTKQILGAP